MIAGIQAQEQQETQLKQQADSFMRQHSADFYDLVHEMEILPDTDVQAGMQKLKAHPFYKAWTGFIEKNGKAMAAIRAERFARYGAPPAAFQQLVWDSASAGQQQLAFDLMSMVFIRSFTPVQPAQVVFGMVMPYITSTTSATIEEVSTIYKVRNLYGMQLYTQPLAENDWQIWLADRTLSVTFRFNCISSAISAVRCTRLGDTAYAAVQWPASEMKPVDTAGQLLVGIQQLLWNNYPGKTFNKERYTDYQQQRNDSLWAFWLRNKQTYISAREQQLRPYIKPQPVLNGYKELTQEGDNVLRNTDTLYAITSFFYPDQWDNVWETAVGSYYEQKPAAIAKRIEENALFGSEHYVKQLTDEEWEVTTVNKSDALRYTWNVAAGRVRNFRYWVKEDSR